MSVGRRFVRVSIDIKKGGKFTQLYIVHVCKIDFFPGFFGAVWNFIEIAMVDKHKKLFIVFPY